MIATAGAIRRRSGGGSAGRSARRREGAAQVQGQAVAAGLADIAIVFLAVLEAEIDAPILGQGLAQVDPGRGVAVGRLSSERSALT